MKNIKRYIAFVLILTLTLPILASCNTSVNEKKHADEVTLDTERKGEKLDIVPDDVKFEGETFTVLCRTDNEWGNYLHELSPDGENADPVDTAVIKRNNEVAERFGIEFNFVDVPGQWDVKDEFISDFRDSVNSGLGQFDLVMSQQAYLANTELFDLYTNMYDVPYIKDDLDSEYFFQNVKNEISVDGNLYFLVGDLCLTYWEYVFVMFFNKKLTEKYGYENIYDLVKTGDWTIDKCIEMSRGVYTDLNGNEMPDPADIYGYITDIVNTTDAWFSQFDVQTTKHVGDGNIILDIDQGKMADILDKMISFFGTNDVYTITTMSSDKQATDQPLDDIFTDGRALFYPASLEHEKALRRTSLSYGLVPYPKWNKTQKGYYSQPLNGYSAAVIPSDAKNLKKSGAVLDVLMAESFRSVTPAYFDETLGVTLRDDDSKEMLDIIKNGVQCNFGYFYYEDLRTGGIIRYLVDNNISYFVSYYAANQRSYEKNLERILNKFQK